MATAKAARRAEQPHVPWTAPAPPLAFGREAFRFTLLRTARGLPALDIDGFVEHVNWERSGMDRTAELNFRRPLTARGATQIANGDIVRCELAPWGSEQWRPLWQLTVGTPSEQIAAGSISISMTSQLKPATKNKAAFKFRKDGTHPSGWTADQITRAVASRFHITLGRVAKGEHHIHRMVDMSTSPLDIIVRAWKQERVHTGRRYDVDMSRGILEVLELKRPAYMLSIGAAIADATIAQRIGSIATSLVVTATRYEKGKRTKHKLRVKVTDPARTKRYGYIVKTVKAPAGIDTLEELRKYALGRLARMHAPRPTITFTHPGLPWLDRGDALMLALPEDGITQLVYVTTVRHDLSAGAYTMDVGIRWTDPFAADAKAVATATKKAAAAQKRNRPTSSSAKAPTPKKAATRK